MMYNYPYNHPTVPGYFHGYYHYPYPRTYPPVDTKTFSSSVQKFRILMEQGSILLAKLGEASFETKMMTAAQQGKQAEVEKLIKSIGLRVPVTTQYTPSAIKFTLQTPPEPNNFNSCCSLTVSLKWGNQ
ncbi:hypothetical protein [Neobacillus sp. LXY-4]|uniref:hypothetical protein n=1 Tax=Neobacillus sp. LXY-4 TaxID=3379826 RepID=UPI003F4A6367